MRTPNTGLRTTLAALLATLVVGCAGNTPTGPADITIADLAGTWTNTQFTITSKADPTQKVDLGALGMSFTIAVTPSGTFTGTTTLPGAFMGMPGVVTVPISGVMRVSDTQSLRIDFVPEMPPALVTFVGPFTLVGDVLTVDDEEEARHDFDGDGATEPAAVHIVLQRS